jgi:hypothetical protein
MRSLSLVALAACLLLTACSEESGQAAQGAPVPTTVVAVDCSKSMKEDSKDWPRQIATLAGATLSQMHRLMVGCFAGTTTTVVWSTDLDGNDAPKVGEGDTDRRAFARQWGESLGPIFARKLQPIDADGTHWLGALETSLELSGVHVVYLLSDLVQQAEGVDVKDDMTDAELAEAAHTWAPRLAKLKHVPLYVIAAGQGVHQTDAARRGRKLLDLIGQEVGFEPHYFTTLPIPPPVA